MGENHAAIACTTRADIGLAHENKIVSLLGRDRNWRAIVDQDDLDARERLGAHARKRFLKPGRRERRDHDANARRRGHPLTDRKVDAVCSHGFCSRPASTGFLAT